MLKRWLVFEKLYLLIALIGMNYFLRQHISFQRKKNIHFLHDIVMVVSHVVFDFLFKRPNIPKRWMSCILKNDLESLVGSKEAEFHYY